MKLSIYALLLATTLGLTASCEKVSQGAQASGTGAANPASPTLAVRTDGSNAPGTPATAAAQPVQPLEIPSGTPLTVRLQTAISSANARPGDRFQAVLDFLCGSMGRLRHRAVPR